MEQIIVNGEIYEEVIGPSADVVYMGKPYNKVAKDYEIISERCSGMNTRLIEQVRRNSDGEVFKLGDELLRLDTYIGSECAPQPTHGTITNFYESTIRGKYEMMVILRLTATHDSVFTLNSARRYKEVIMTTEDGVTIYDKNEKVWAVNVPDGYALNNAIIVSSRAKSSDYKWFSTQEAAKQYAKQIKKVLSSKDLQDTYDELMNGTLYPTPALLLNKLQNLIETRL